MNCQICLERYNTANRIPKNLSCGHTFCDRCLKKLAAGYEIECPKCRQKSKNNLPICYPIYDYLILENKADIDEPCSLHEYEKLQFYCNKDKTNICALCLSSLHQGHFVSSIKDKILADENEQVLSKWNNYFMLKKEDFYNKKEKLNQIMKEFESQKINLTREISLNYDKLILENFNKSKTEILKEMEELFCNESAQLRDIKIRLDENLTNISEFESNLGELDKSMNILSNQAILSINMEEFNRKDREYSEKMENLVNEKSKIKFKTIKFNDDAVFSKKEIILENFLSEESKLKNHILLLGDYKDRVILNYDISNKKWTKMESTFGGEFNFLDYSCICQYKNDVLLIAGGCVYSNYRNTASKNCYLAKVISKDQITFTEFKTLNNERFSHGICVVKGTPYVFGGHNGLNTLNTIEYFDDREVCWKISPSTMFVEREIFAHCVVKDRYIYAFGGFNDTHLDSIEKFDTVNHKWRMLNVKMKKSLQNSTAVPINDDQIALIGGYNGTMHKSIDILNLTTMTWTSVDKMKVPRRRSHCYKFEDKVRNYK
jgi:hypothetical protein